MSTAATACLKMLNKILNYYSVVNRWLETKADVALLDWVGGAEVQTKVIRHKAAVAAAVTRL